MFITSAIIAGLVALAQAAGQSIQQWISSPQGQQQIQNLIQQYGPDAIQAVLRELGIKI